MEAVFKHSRGLRIMFLAVTPNETSFETVEEVPNYVQSAVPYLMTMIMLETALRYFQGKPLPRMNATFGSSANGVLVLLDGLLFRSISLKSFVWTYERVNIVQLPWDNPWTWLVTLICVDFAFYWFHRSGHGVEYLKGEERSRLLLKCIQSALMACPSTVNLVLSDHPKDESNVVYKTDGSLIQEFFYMPLALFIPPSVFLVHEQFNRLFQAWIHTETIGTLGPVEWFLNTPSHHRVHHGRNPYCVDKNFGGILIIWDRLFGTFEAERKDEKIFYGLIHNIDTWDPIYAQFFHYKHIIRTAWNMEGFSNKLSVLCKGPGWSPGKPRLGLPEEIPKIDPNSQKYDSSPPFWNSLYVWIHYALIFAAWNPSLGLLKQSLTTLSLIRNIAFIVWSLSLFGAMYDKKRYSDLQELLRCVVFVIWTSVTNDVPLGRYFLWLYIPSALLWTVIVLAGGTQQLEKKKKQK